MKLSDKIISLIRNDLRWNEFTPIQKKVIPEILSGKNVLISSKTASGKTEAAILPILDILNRKRESGISLVYFAPLKALINDIFIRLNILFNRCNLNLIKWHGDVAKKNLYDAHAIITTPESMEGILISNKSKKEFFNSLKFIIVDEVHYFAENTRGSQLVCLIERLKTLSKNNPRIIGLSATIGNPQGVSKWLFSSKDVKNIIVKDDEKNKLSVKVISEEEITIIELVENLVKEKNSSKILIFTNSRKQAEKIAEELNKTNIKSSVHHGSISKNLRESIEDDFKKDKGLKAVVATSTLELGIDIGNIDEVIFTDVPFSASSFVQRVGRSGRKTKHSKSWIMLSDNRSVLRLFGIINMLSKTKVEDINLISYYPQILAHQLISLSFQNKIINKNDYKNLVAAYPASEIEIEDAKKIFNFLEEKSYIARFNNSFKPSSETNEIMEVGYKKMKFVVTFRSSKEFKVFFNNFEIGELHPIFVQKLQDSLKEENEAFFTLAKKNWKVIKINERSFRIDVVQSKNKNIPEWFSFFGKMNFSFCQSIKHYIIEKNELNYIKISKNSKEKILNALNNESVNVLNDKIVWNVFEYNNIFQNNIFSFYGSLGNAFFSILIKIIECTKIKYNWKKISFYSTIPKAEVLKEILELINKSKEQIVTLICDYFEENEKEIKQFLLSSGDILSKYISKPMKIKFIANYIFDQKVIDDLKNNLKI